MNEAWYYPFYWVPFMMSAFIAIRSFQVWRKTKNKMTGKICLLFSCVTIIFAIAANDTQHTVEWMIIIFCTIGIYPFFIEFV